MFIEAILLSIIVGLIRGGNLLNIAHLPLRRIELIMGSFILQLGIQWLGRTGSTIAADYGTYIHILSYILLVLAIYFNRHIAGIPILGTGILLNFIVVALNEGRMPTRGDVLPKDLYNILASKGDALHSLLSSGANLKFLGDIIYIPYPLQPQLISIGDIFITVGVFLLIQKAMKPSGPYNYYKVTSIRHRL